VKVLEDIMLTRENFGMSSVGWAFWITAALAFGAFLASPVPELPGNLLAEALPAMSVMRTAEDIHNEASASKEADAPCVRNSGGTSDSDSTFVPTDSGIELVVSEPPAEIQPDYICLSVNRGGVANRKEKDVLIHLINAEAYGLSYKAKVAVGQVVMNRWTGPYYGDDLLAIMTAPHQFTPIYDGSAYEKTVESDSIRAANAVLSGAGVTELTDDTYYFVNPDFTQDKTIEQNMEFVCEIEGIHFYKPPVK
jgi:hypothetical protein